MSENELWYPTLAGAAERKIDTCLGLVNVIVGGKQDGLSIVLWPSLMLKGTMWSEQYKAFSLTHNIVLIDSPGVGKSENLRKLIDLRDCKNCLVEILDALKIKKCVFGGNSWGAMLAAVLPAWIPERLLGSMVINGTASLPTMPETIIMTLRAELLMMTAKVPDWWVNSAQAAFAGDSAEANNPEFMAYLKCVSKEEPKSIAWAIKGILLGRKDMHEVLRTIDGVPVLVIAGEEDRQFPVHICRKMADAIKGSRFVVMKQTGHLAARERPAEVNEEITKFLAEIGAAG